MKLWQALSFTTAVSISGASLAADDPITAARFSISVDGVQVSAKSLEGGGIASATKQANTTPLRITIDRTGSEPIWQWLAASFDNGAVKKKIEAQVKGKPRAVFAGAMISQVSFSELKASDGKKHMDVTLTVVPESIAAAPAPKSPAPSAKPKPWSPANFRVKMGGLPLARVTKIDSFTIKQKLIEKGKPPVLVLESARLTLAAADAKTLTGAIAKDAAQPLEIAFTNQDGSVWKTLVVKNLSVVSTKIGKAATDVTIKGSKIHLN